VIFAQLRPEWRLYRLRRRRHWWWFRGRLLYIGQTRRLPLARLLEHMLTKSWAREVGSIHVGWRRYRSEAAVLAAERRAIHRQQPVHNVAHNGTRPRRSWP
jgi:hypothetical protein